MSAWQDNAEKLDAVMLRALAETNRRHAALRTSQGKTATAGKYARKAKKLDEMALQKDLGAAVNARIDQIGDAMKAGRVREARCVECDRVFDLTDASQSKEWFYGHDCEG